MPQPTTQTDQATELVEQLRESRDWMRDTYWSEWEEVYKNYKCRVDTRKDSDGKDDPDKTNIGMPDTFALVNRRTARITAQIPNIGFTADEKDEAVEQAVSRKVMWDWDNGGVQRSQKRHVRQAEMLGWSVRSWYWEVNEYTRKKGIDISGPLSDQDYDLIAKTYKSDPQQLRDPMMGPVVLKRLMEEKGKRGLLDVRYDYKAYEGPRSEVLFSGDCYPKPFFGSIQTGGHLILERRRDKAWLMKLGKRYPKFAPGIEEMLSTHPKGTAAGIGSTRDDGQHLRDKLRAAVGMPTTSQSTISSQKGTGLWTILERWIPGRQAKVAYVGEERHWFGEMESPYDLDGLIPFSDLILIDDILEGIGDSVARITRGLQAMHNLTTNTRFDIYRQIAYPMYGTDDRALFDNPEMLRRDIGRLIHMRGGERSFWTISDQQAMSAMVASMGEESAQQRMFQLAGGDSNMSMAANVDPAQLRTATGAKMLQANQDVLTKDLIDAFHQTSVICDVNLMYLLNRSEMGDAVNIDASKYDRNYNPASDARKEFWIKAEPHHFQVDGRMTVELGSTLADDDEAKVAVATNLFQMLQGNPLVNQETLTRDLLVAHGKGPKLAEYMQEPQPGPPPLKGSMSVSVDLEKCDEATKRVVLKEAGIDPAAVQEMQQQIEQEVAQQAGMDPMMGAPMPDAGIPAPELDPANLLAMDAAQ